MKGLILKDFYMMKKYMKMNILMLFLLAALIFAPDNTVLIIVPYLVLLQMPISLIGYEENCGWDAYAATLPCTKKRQVDEKFLLSLAIQAVSFALVCAFELAGFLRAGEGDLRAFCGMMVFVASSGLIFSSASLCVAFALGVEKGRMTYIVAMLTLVALFSLGISALSAQAELAGSIAAVVAFLPYALPAIGVIAYLALWKAARKLYYRREK